MTTWKWIVFDHAKPHMVSASLAPHIIADMVGRDCPVKEQKVSRSFTIDLPGMCRVDRPIEKFTVCGLRVEMPTEDVATFLLVVEGLQPRTAGGKQYYKLHGFMRCWVLTHCQRASLLVALRRRALGAEQRAQAFYADKKSPAAILREAAAKVTGKPVEQIGDLGGHKLDRFFSGPKGAA